MNANLGAIKIHIEKARPLPGFCFIKLEGAYDEKVGLIHIPDKYRTRRAGFGKIVAWNPTKKQNCSFGTDAVIGWYAVCHDYAKVHIADGIFRIPIDCVLGIVDEPLKLTGVSSFNGVERCQWCGPAKAGSPNSMLCDENGYCYRCGKNALGEKRDEFTEKKLEPFMNPRK